MIHPVNAPLHFTNIKSKKNATRKSMKEQISKISPEMHVEAAHQIWDKIVQRMHQLTMVAQLCGYEGRLTLFGFAGMSSEPDWFSLWQDGVRKGVDWGFEMALPVSQKIHPLPFYQISHPDHLQIGVMGIREPDVEKCQRVHPGLFHKGKVPLAAIAVPGIAFGKQGERLGRGAGYYDRFLASIPPEIPRWGIAYTFQVIDDLPCEEHDQKVHDLILVSEPKDPLSIETDGVSSGPKVS